MPTYLSRPVWGFPLQWDSPTQAMEFDQLPHRIGFGAPLYAPTQQQVARGWRVGFWLKGGQAIVDYEEFSDPLKGRFKGFWFPEPRVTLTVVSSSGPGVAVIRACGLVDQWDAGAQYHLWLVDPSGVVAKSGAVITGVTASGPGQETVSFSGAVSPQPGWMIHRLLYMRQGADDQRWRCLAEHWEERELSVVELPLEYGDMETGEAPVYLYEFSTSSSAGVETVNRYTSLSENYTADGNAYATLPINHGVIVRSDDSDYSLDIQTVYKDGLPWEYFTTHTIDRVLIVTVKKIPYGTSTGAEVLFSGRLKKDGSTISGAEVSLAFGWWGDGANRIPKRVYGPLCPHELYEPTTCGVDPAAHELAVTVVVTTDLTVTVTGAGLVSQPAGYFALGRIVFGTGATEEIRGINWDSGVTAGELQLNLSIPLRHATAGTTGVLRPGCDGKGATCFGKFANKARHGGFEHLPRANAVVTPAEVAGGGGKGK
jgi:hypothetical protein